MQVPNRYYNSPWIADAAANLTDALFGNPQRDLARLQAQSAGYEMNRQLGRDARQTVLDQRADADYERNLQLANETRDNTRLGREAFSRALTTEDPGQRMRHLGDAARLGGVDDKAIFTASGAAGPEHEAEKALVDEKLKAQALQFEDRLKFLYEQMRTGNATKLYGIERQVDMNNADNALRARLAEIDAMYDQGGTLDRRDPFFIQKAIDALEDTAKVKLTPQQRIAVQSYAEQRKLPISAAWNIALQGQKLQPGEPTLWGFGAPGPGSFVPGTPNLSDPLAGPAMPTQAAPTARPSLDSFKR